MSSERKNKTSTVTLIDERKKIEDALKDSLARHKALLEHLPYKIFHKDRNSTYVTCNENFARDLGVTSQEIIGKNDFDFYPMDSAAMIRRDDKRIMDSGRNENIEEKYTQDGQQRIIHTTKLPVRNDYGEVIGILGILWNGTERKKANDRPQESEKRFEEMIDFLPLTVFEIDLKGNITFTNHHGFKTFAYTPEDIERGMSAFQLFVPEEREMVGQNIHRILKGKKSKGHEYTMLKKNGETLPVLIYSVPIISKGKTIGLRGIVIDITGRKLAEEELRESEEKYKTLVESAEDFIFMIDKDNKVLSLNKAAARILGKEPDEIVGKSIFNIFPERLAASYSANLKSVFESGETLSSETKLIIGDRELWISVSLNPVRDHQGKITSVMGVTRDVTKWKRTQETLKESEERFRDLFEHANDLIQSVDGNGNFLYVNSKWIETLGYSDEELKELNLMDILREDQIPHCMDTFRRVCSGESFEKVETVFKAKDGREINVEGDVNAHWKDGKFIATRGIFRDVTERVRSEQELRKTIHDLERFNRLTIGREHRMIELKREVNELLRSMGHPEKYKLPSSKDTENVEGG